MAWIVVAWAGVSVAALSYLGVPEKLRELRTPYAERPVFDASKDPKVGTTVPLPETDVLGRDIRGMAATARRVILVVYGGCDECSARNLDPRSIPRHKGDLVIAVWMSAEETVLKRAEHSLEGMVAVADPKGVVGRKLNGYCVPRAYILDNRSGCSRASLIARIFVSG